MQSFLEMIRQPWPWYVVGPLIGLTVPLLLLMGNRSLGISSSLRHLCAACIPARVPFFHYDWRKESWNLFFIAGIFIGGIIATFQLSNYNDLVIHPALQQDLAAYGVTDTSELVPPDLFNLNTLFTWKGFVLMIVGGFLVGFGTRYAGGCTSGHTIMGLSTLQWPSLVATVCFMVGGLLVANFVLPVILSL
jgi:hypothetical protein